MRIAFHQLPPTSIGQQGQLRPRIGLAQSSQYRRGQHQIANLHEIYDQYVLIHANKSPQSS